MANICIIGTPGAGKTVFLTVLAKRYEKRVESGQRLEFLNPETSRYVNDVWNKLTREQEWPPSTPPGEFPNLLWQLHTGNVGDERHVITVLDAPGQDIRAIFDPKPHQSLNQEQVGLKQHLDLADLLVILINPVEAINAQQTGNISDVEIPVKMAIDHALRREHTQIALLLSQHDQTQEILTHDDPIESLADCELHAIHGLALGMKERIQVSHIASVADTEIFNDGAVTGMRPKLNFNSEGLEEVMNWLVESVESIPPQIVYSEPSPNFNTLPDLVTRPSDSESYVRWILTALGIIFALYLLFSMGSCAINVIKDWNTPDIVPCENCGGDGVIEIPLWFDETCDHCRGSGKITTSE